MYLLAIATYDWFCDPGSHLGIGNQNQIWLIVKGKSGLSCILNSLQITFWFIDMIITSLFKSDHGNALEYWINILGD